MTLHPSVLAAFRGGPTPTFPSARVWHEQYVSDAVDHGVWWSGFADGVPVVRVVKLTGSELWYRPADLADLLDHGNAYWRGIALEVRTLC